MAGRRILRGDDGTVIQDAGVHDSVQPDAETFSRTSLATMLAAHDTSATTRPRHSDTSWISLDLCAPPRETSCGLMYVLVRVSSLYCIGKAHNALYLEMHLARLTATSSCRRSSGSKRAGASPHRPTQAQNKRTKDRVSCEDEKR